MGGLHHAEHHGEHHSLLSLGQPSEIHTFAISVWLIALVLFTIFFELFLRSVEMRLGPRTSPGNHMLSKVKDELMLMGVLSFGLTMFEQAVEVSHEFKLAFEWAHTLLFLAAVVLVFLAMFLLFVVEKLSRSLHAMENTKIQDLSSLVRSISPGHVEVSHTKVCAKRAGQFHAIRHEFLMQHNLPHSFDFTLYVHDILADVVVEFLEIHPESWGVVIFLAAANAVRVSVGSGMALYSAQAEMAAFASFGWLLLVFTQVVLSHARQRFSKMLKRFNVHDSEQLSTKLADAHARQQAALAAGSDFAKERAKHHHKKKLAHGKTVGKLRRHQAKAALHRQHTRLAHDSSDIFSPTALASEPHSTQAKPALHRQHTRLADDSSEVFSTTAFSSKPHSTRANQHDNVHADGAEHHDELAERAFSSLLLLVSLYVAAFFLRYVNLASALGGTQGVAFVLSAVLPVSIAAFVIHEVIDLTSFEIAVSHFDEHVSERVLEISYRTMQDAIDFRSQFIDWFKETQGATRNTAVLHRVFHSYCDGATGEISPNGLARLLHDIYGHVPAERQERLWRELNYDFAGGISFQEFKSFLVARGKHVPAGAYAVKLFSSEEDNDDCEDQAAKGAENDEADAAKCDQVPSSVAAGPAQRRKAGHQS